MRGSVQSERMLTFKIKITMSLTSLEVQWVDSAFPMQGMWTWYLVEILRSWVLHGVAKKNKKKNHPKNELLCLCEAWLCHILDKLLCLRFFRYKLERTNSHKVTSCLFLQNKLSPNLVIWNKHFICSWMYVFWAQLGGSLASLTWGPLTWLKSRARSPEAGWSQLTSFPCLVVGGGCWLTLNLQWLRVFLTLRQDFKSIKREGDPLFAVCALYFVGSNKGDGQSQSCFGRGHARP